MSQPDDPERLADAPSRSQLGELFASASRDVPSDEQLSRLAAQLGPLLDNAPGAPPRPSPPGWSLPMKLAVATGTVAVLVGAALTLRRSSHTAADSPTVTPSATVRPGAPVSSEPPAPAALPTAAAAPPSANEADAAGPLHDADAANAKPPAARSQAPSEASLLEQARRALNTSPSFALQLANQHRARFPNGILSQEREVIAIEALKRLHRTSEADQRAAGFSKSFPGSAHQRMVDEVAPK